MSEPLTALLARAETLAGSDARARLQWIEDVATAAEAEALGEDGAQGALHLRAALGAFVRFAGLTDAQRSDPRTQAELSALVRTLLARGTLALYRALAAHYDALVVARAPHRAACAAMRDAFREAAQAVERGEEVSEETRARMRAAQDSLSG